MYLIYTHQRVSDMQEHDRVRSRTRTTTGAAAAAAFERADRQLQRPMRIPLAQRREDLGTPDRATSHDRPIITTTKTASTWASASTSRRGG